MKYFILAFSLLLSISSSTASTSFTEIFDSLVNHSASTQSRTVALPTVTLREKHKPIVLSSLNVTVKIAGPIAQTSYEMVFYNPMIVFSKES